MALDDHALAGPLPCGTLFDDLVSQVFEGVAPLDRAHQAACRYCDAALETIRQAWEDFQVFARAAVTVPDDLSARVMDGIRSIAGIGDEAVQIATERGATRITQRVLGHLARAAAESVEDVAWASAVALDAGADHADGVSFAVRLVVILGVAFPQIADDVRERVIAEIEGRAGTPVAGVEIVVDDVIVPAGGDE